MQERFSGSSAKLYADVGTVNVEFLHTVTFHQTYSICCMFLRPSAKPGRSDRVRGLVLTLSVTSA
jgi:hypothetical protein